MEEENKTIIKALNMYGRVPEMWELLEEIERLNNIINKLEKYLIEQVEKSYSNDYDNVLDKLYELTGENNDK